MPVIAYGPTTFELFHRRCLRAAQPGAELHHFQLHPHDTRWDTERLAQLAVEGQGRESFQSEGFRTMMQQLGRAGITVYSTLVTHDDDVTRRQETAVRYAPAITEGIENVRLASYAAALHKLGDLAHLATMLQEYAASTTTASPAHSLWAYFPRPPMPPTSVYRVMYDRGVFIGGEVHGQPIDSRLAAWANAWRGQSLTATAVDLH